MKRLLLLALVLAAGCKGKPASVQIVMSLQSGTTPPANLTVSVYDVHGRLIDAAPMGDPPLLPGDVTVLVDDDALVVRAFAFGKTAKGRSVWAAGRVEVAPSSQSRLDLALAESTPPDLDGDGVPDPIDNCPGTPNDNQASAGGPKGDACNNSGGPGDMGADMANPVGGGKDGGVVTGAACGNGALDTGEECDDGTLNSDSAANIIARCTTGCRLRANCGLLVGAVAAAIDPSTGHCYVAWPGPLNWASSQRECLRNGGDLVSIGSQSENDVVRGLVAGTAWIGSFAAPNTINFKWVDGSPNVFTFFAPGEPVAGDECLRTGTDGWHSDNCGWPSNGGFALNQTNALPFVCESACGNGKVDPGETCDPPGPTCSKTCHKLATCAESGAQSLPENGHCYFAAGNNVSYSTALATTCPTGTHLATLDTPAETEVALKVAGNNDIWIALSAMQTLAVFKWDIVNDAIFNQRRYHAFGGNDPNQNPPACTAITNNPPSGAVGWRDRNCNSDTYPALCERDQ